MHSTILNRLQKEVGTDLNSLLITTLDQPTTEKRLKNGRQQTLCSLNNYLIWLIASSYLSMAECVIE